jgi:hypothetical protein
MKALLTIILLSFTQAALCQTINISVNTEKSSTFDSPSYQTSAYKSSIDSAFILMNAVFNSKEFISLLENAKFPCKNRCCTKCRRNRSFITEKEILDSLRKDLNVSWAIHLKEKCKGKLGATAHNAFETEACLWNITNDMDRLPLAYKIAVNLCHEYMHHIGFYHSNFKLNDIDKETPNPDGYANDIAYRVGWDVYQLLSEWHKNNVIIPGL